MCDSTGAAARVALGVEFLDKNVPNWRDCIVRDVNMMSVTECILGQMYGDASDGSAHLCLTDEELIEYGFDAPTALCEIDNCPGDALKQYEALTAAWKAVL